MTWSGLAVVGGGVSTWYTTGSAHGLATDLHTLFNACKASFPTNLTLLMESSGEEIESTTGSLVGSWTGATLAAIVGTGSTSFAAGVGARIRWDTAGITRGRRVRGSTYVAPLSSDQYDSGGTIAPGTVLGINTALATLLAGDGADMVVWSRPYPNAAAANGAIHPVLTATMPDKVSWLKSRRT